MKIAVTSQNRREITKEASFHDSSRHAAHPLDGVDMLIAGGMGSGLQARLARAEPHAHAHGADHGLDHDHEGGRSCGSGCDCA
jgi:hypothetical protein